MVLSHPTQYYSPWFQWLRRNTALEFRVFYLWDFGVTKRHDPNFGRSIQWDVDLISGYESEFVPNAARNPGPEHFFGLNNPGISRQLAAWRPNAVLLFGYKWASHLRVVAWSRLHGVPVLFRGDSNLIGRPRPALHMRAALLVLFAQFRCFLYVGSANREYFKAFGVPDDRLFFAPHSVNAAFFTRNDPNHREEADRLRRQLDLRPETKVILFAGKLVPGKQSAELLQAYLQLSRSDSALVFVGDGPEKDRLLALAREARGANVHFLPFANQTEMPSRYLMADIFALPSLGETWGLAVNEAMHMGVPCIVSNRVGCQRDLVNHGETGWVFDAGVPGALGDAVLRGLDDVGDRSVRDRMRRAVEDRIKGYTYVQTTNGLLAALDSLAR